MPEHSITSPLLENLLLVWDPWLLWNLLVRNCILAASPDHSWNITIWEAWITPSSSLFKSNQIINSVNTTSIIPEILFAFYPRDHFLNLELHYLSSQLLQRTSNLIALFYLSRRLYPFCELCNSLGWKETAEPSQENTHTPPPCTLLYCRKFQRVHRILEALLKHYSRPPESLSRGFVLKSTCHCLNPSWKSQL